MKQYFFNFLHPWILFLLLLIPVILLLARYYKKNTTLPVSSLDLFQGISPSFKQKSEFVLTWMRVLALALIIIALARPQSGYKFTESISEGIDIMLAIDTSGSMKALDFQMKGDESNRLDVIKNVVSNFIAKRKYDRTGIVVFGEEAFTQCPLTMDTEILSQLVKRLKIGMAGDGTAIGNGLALAVKRLRNQKAKSRVVILLTDGRNNSGDLSPEVASELAKQLGIKVYAVGVGSQGPVPYPEETPFGIRKIYAQLDLDEDTLKAVANTTGGRYFRATDTEELATIYNEIDALEKTKVDVKEYKEVNEKFPFLILVALLLLLLEKIMNETYWFKLP
ncbi:MAG: hypothetical protein ACD_73C00111G0004 [uncultured bacterium]|nr:MAG: hypothetical protein ACD_73C00111G0004 [uncultured bacterium]